MNAPGSLDFLAPIPRSRAVSAGDASADALAREREARPSSLG
jgi:anaerobic glycerol-3-phosphate dehydrogenase